MTSAEESYSDFVSQLLNDPGCQSNDSIFALDEMDANNTLLGDEFQQMWSCKFAMLNDNYCYKILKIINHTMSIRVQ